jgi:hypothetical protein
MNDQATTTTLPVGAWISYEDRANPLRFGVIYAVQPSSRVFRGAVNGMTPAGARYSVAWESGDLGEAYAADLDRPDGCGRHRYHSERGIATPDEIAALLAKHEQLARKIEADREAHAEALAEARRRAQAARPAWAVCAIIAERIVDDSDPTTDYFADHAEAVYLLGWSKHDRDLFSEMRKAAAASTLPEVHHLGPGCDEWRVLRLADKSNPSEWRTYAGAIADASGIDTWSTEAEARAAMEKAIAAGDAPNGAEPHRESIEHRNKHSMGAGYFLQRGGRYRSGWRVRKVSAANDWKLPHAFMRPDGVRLPAARQASQPQPASQPAATAAAPSPMPADDRPTVTRNEERNGVEIRFPRKPADALLADLKAHGWRWSRFAACWYNRHSPEAVAYADALAAGVAP